MLPRPCLQMRPGCPRWPPPPPTCPYHPTFLSWSAAANAAAVLEVGEHSVLFFIGVVHPLEVTKEASVDEAAYINFAISGVAPPPPPIRPTTLGHVANTTPDCLRHS